MLEIETNKKAWGLLAKDHYEHFSKKLLAGEHALNPIIQRELGDIGGKSLIHLQCNTGADTVLLARMADSAIGVDLVPDNIRYASRLAAELNQRNARFVESDLMRLRGTTSDRFDVVFTSEGVIGWLPDLTVWAETIHELLQPGGFFYVFDSHPILMAMDEDKLENGILEIRYPYFTKTADPSEDIGGYAGPRRQGLNYFWMYTMGEVVNALADAGLRIVFLHEYDRLFFDMGSMKQDSDGFYYHEALVGKLPLSFSLKAVKPFP